ncbi:FGGY-family carbohydrate kinase [Cohaesibacter sp. CAU 1516]|uniref:FGGY-family carbohydrate kinase n=1 Tax=Cohaesibacter sp. CAU 1516 TaxID=2576038 RepID=UPI0010FE600A|nr:FGGY-family carbohydrate kinase [Cohaesibacter sp. CAU 1516]TLP48122.1 FGGY-family carbohydrate kinase [Cohaesibacter sp. CAU 1516]
MATCFMGIDVGTGSARAGIFDQAGRMLSTAKCDITVFHEPGSRVEQSSSEIWQAVATSSKGALVQAGIDPADVVGVGFDATCSLVVLGEGGTPLPIGDDANGDRDIIVWMDHRSIEQAERINKMGHRVLDYVGGIISPEMETPKLLWLKEHKPEIFAKAWRFFDLTDYLTWRATGSDARSICTVTCKWTYMGHEASWDADYFTKIGLGILAEEGFERIGTQVVDAGTPLGTGLSAEAAADLGLVAGTAVGAGLIDAHAGGIGTVGATGAGKPQDNLGYVFGTSSCTMTSTDEPVFVPGVWGPYFSAMVPGLWLNEGGQSAAGAAIAQLLTYHPAAGEAGRLAKADGCSLPDWLAVRAVAMAGADKAVASLADGMHVVPEFIGNRAPYGDPHTRAVIAGLGMEADIDNLVALYVAGVCSLGYGLRQIIEAQAEAGAKIQSIVISGGAGRSDLVRQLLADATGVRVAAPATQEPVLLGSAILGAVAGGAFGTVADAMAAMSSIAADYPPADGAIRAYHDTRYDLFKRFQNLAREAAVRS